MTSKSQWQWPQRCDNGDSKLSNSGGALSTVTLSRCHQSHVTVVAVVITTATIVTATTVTTVTTVMNHLFRKPAYPSNIAVSWCFAETVNEFVRIRRTMLIRENSF
jgi:hypothetical protein